MFGYRLLGFGSGSGKKQVDFDYLIVASGGAGDTGSRGAGGAGGDCGGEEGGGRHAVREREVVRGAGFVRGAPAGPVQRDEVRTPVEDPGRDPADDPDTAAQEPHRAGAQRVG